ncbi:MAG: hypothetical protein ACM3PP_07595, partial [Candidatus Saccharibacteria bacterium]
MFKKDSAMKGMPQAAVEPSMGTEPACADRQNESRAKVGIWRHRRGLKRGNAQRLVMLTKVTLVKEPRHSGFLMK